MLMLVELIWTLTPPGRGLMETLLEKQDRILRTGDRVEIRPHVRELTDDELMNFLCRASKQAGEQTSLLEIITTEVWKRNQKKWKQNHGPHAI